MKLSPETKLLLGKYDTQISNAEQQRTMMFVIVDMIYVISSICDNQSQPLKDSDVTNATKGRPANRSLAASFER